MPKNIFSTQKNLSLLLSGKDKRAKKYAGKHVLVVKNTVVLLERGTQGKKDFDRLKKQYHEPPVVVFIPRHDVSYILICR